MYPLTFFVKSLPSGVGGCANGPVIRILAKYRNDRGIYQHELTHVLQWLFVSLLGMPVAYLLIHLGRTDLMYLSAMFMALHSALYRFVPAYRLWAEVQAYREQAKWYPDDRRPLFARFIAENYGLKVTQAQVLPMLR